MNWKEIENTNGRYLVSDDGRVFSVLSNRIIKQQLNNTGYYRVELNINGVVKRLLVHRIVAKAFIPNPNNYEYVNHKDENPKNNHVDNLEWCTQKYNANYGTCIQRRVLHTHYKTGSENHQSKEVFQFDLNGNFIAHYESANKAAVALDLSRKSIAKARSGTLKQYAGYVWCPTKEFKPVEKRTHFVAGAVIQYDKDGNIVREYEKPSLVKSYGFDPNAVRDVCRGKAKQHKGFVFSYKDMGEKNE